MTTILIPPTNQQSTPIEPKSRLSIPTKQTALTKLRRLGTGLISMRMLAVARRKIGLITLIMQMKLTSIISLIRKMISTANFTEARLRKLSKKLRRKHSSEKLQRRH